MKEVEQGWLSYRPSISNSQNVEYRVSPYNRLRLILEDARAWLTTSSVEPFDAIYFDAFSPATNPELWNEDLFARVRTQLRHGGKLVSYCVSGAVRRAFQNAGFDVERLPGPPAESGKCCYAVCPVNWTAPHGNLRSHRRDGGRNRLRLPPLGSGWLQKLVTPNRPGTNGQKKK